MRNILTLTAAALLLFGCTNDNKIEIQNIAEYQIYVNFRANIYEVPGISTEGPDGGKLTISGVPNGTYQYKTMWYTPDELNLSIAPAAESDGNLTFEKQSTRVLMQYGSATLGSQYYGSLSITTTNSAGN
jgi:hypothetical protein